MPLTRRVKWACLGLSWLFLIAASPAHAQVASLGKGWLLDSAGAVTSTAGEVISGRNSIKGSASPSNAFASFLVTDPTFIAFAPRQTYTITLNYRIVTAGSPGFSFGFFSGLAGAAGPFVPTGAITGPAGATGSATLTATLFNFTDYRAGFKIDNGGAIVIDDIRITSSAGQLVASENAEGPAIVPGLLNFQLTDAIALLPASSAAPIGAVARDLNGDGYPEMLMTISAPRPCNVPIEPIVLEASGRLRVATADFFPGGAPTVKCSPMILFADINNDGLPDVLFSDAGSDPIGPGSRIGIALNLGGGRYRDVSALIPPDQQATRSYAIAVGDVLGDGRVDIILPDENDGSNTVLLRWNGNGFDEIRNWVPLSLWTGFPTYMRAQSWMVLSDLDLDGRQDLLVTGQDHNPNFQILYGAPGGFNTASLVTLPDGPFGHFNPSLPAQPVMFGTGEVSPVVVADFNNDGLPDIFAIERQIASYQPGVYTDTNDPDYANIRANGGFVYLNSTFSMLLNQGSRRFTDVRSASSRLDLGRGEYSNLYVVDINNDGFLDVVGQYQSDSYAGVRRQFGTTLFLNDGTGAFQVVDGADLLAAVTTTPPNGQRWNLGSFVPTVVNPQRTEGIVFEPVGGCGGAGLCAAQGLNFYKVVANRAIATGPGFVDPASLGVPGFNEWYYLRHYPDAAAAVQAGQYASGLAHYVAVGRARGYLAHAPSAVSSGGPSGLTSTVSGSTVTLTWQPPAAGVLSYVVEAGSSSGLADLASIDTGSTTTTVTANNVAPGTYFVRVRARTAAGSSAPSNEVTVTVGGGSCAGAPGAPTGLVSSVSGHAVTLTWQAPSGGCPATSYVLEAGSASGLTNLGSFSTGSAAPSFATTGVPTGIYFVRVRAANGALTSGPSSEVTVTVP